MRLMEEIFQFSRSKVEFYPSILIDVSSFSHIFSIDFDGFCRFFWIFQLFFALNRHLILFSRSFFCCFPFTFHCLPFFFISFLCSVRFFPPAVKKKASQYPAKQSLSIRICTNWSNHRSNSNQELAWISMAFELSSIKAMKAIRPAVQPGIRKYSEKIHRIKHANESI